MYKHHILVLESVYHRVTTKSKTEYRGGIMRYNVFMVPILWLGALVVVVGPATYWSVGNTRWDKNVRYTRCPQKQQHTHTNLLLLRIYVYGLQQWRRFLFFFNNNNFCFTSTRRRLRGTFVPPRSFIHVNRRNWLNGSRRLDIIAVAYLAGESIFVVKTPQRKYTS